jgi:hypothetical protein
MFSRRSHLGVAVVAALLLSGCDTISNTADSIWSSLSGDEDTAQSNSTGAAKATTPGGTVVAIPPSAAEANPQPTNNAPSRQPPALGTGNFAATPATPGSPTGTYVGAKVQSLRGDLQRLLDNINRHNGELQQVRQALAQDAAKYFGLVGTINSRLQIGTTPGNPELMAQWNQAQGALDHMSDDIAKLNSLANQAASDSSLAAYILESVKAAYALQGAVDEDHRQLRLLEGDVNRTVVLIDQLLNAISDDISRQTAYVSNERSNLVTLSLAIKNGELYGQNLANRAFSSAAPPALAQRSSSLAASERRPLVVIRFDRPNVAYEQALYTAVRRALERRPDANFDLVAVAPNAGSPAQVALHTDASKRNAENVLRSLTTMGLPADRITLSATTSPSVQNNEVQIYVR